ncbi:PA14 domain-containing protein [Streptomyces anulatus]
MIPSAGGPRQLPARASPTSRASPVPCSHGSAGPPSRSFVSSHAEVKQQAKAPGLTGRYYASPAPTGTPVTTRTDSVIDFTSTPVDTLPAVWSATWSGTLTPTHSGPHRFSLLAAGTATLKLAAPSGEPLGCVLRWIGELGSGCLTWSRGCAGTDQVGGCVSWRSRSRCWSPSRSCRLPSGR